MGFKLLRFKDKSRPASDDSLSRSGPAVPEAKHDRITPRLLKRLSKQDAKKRQAEDEKKLGAAAAAAAVAVNPQGLDVSDNTDQLETGFDLADLTPGNARIGDLVQTMDKRTMQRILERDACRRAKIRETVSTYVQSQTDPEDVADAKYGHKKQQQKQQQRQDDNHFRLDEGYGHYSKDDVNSRLDYSFNGATPRNNRDQTPNDSDRFLSDIQHDLTLKTDMVARTSTVLRNLTAQNILAQQERFKQESLDIPSSPVHRDYSKDTYGAPNSQSPAAADDDDLYQDTRPETDSLDSPVLSGEFGKRAHNDDLVSINNSNNNTENKQTSRPDEEDDTTTNIGQAVYQESFPRKTDSPANDGSESYETADEVSDSYLESIDSGSIRRQSQQSQDMLFETMLPTLDGRNRQRPFEKLEIHHVAVGTGWQ